MDIEVTTGEINIEVTVDTMSITVESTEYNVTVQPAAMVTGSFIVSDGSNTYNGITSLLFSGATVSQTAEQADNREVTVTITGGGGGASTFLQLTDTPNSYDGEELRLLNVNAEGDGIVFTNPDFINLDFVTTNGNTTDNTISIGEYIILNDGNGNSSKMQVSAALGTVFQSNQMVGYSFQSTATDEVSISVLKTDNSVGLTLGYLSALDIGYIGVNGLSNVISITSDGTKIGFFDGSPATSLDISAIDGITIGQGVDEDIALFNIKDSTYSATVFWNSTDILYEFKDGGVLSNYGVLATTGQSNRAIEAEFTITTDGVVSGQNILVGLESDTRYQGTHAFTDLNGLGIGGALLKADIDSTASTSHATGAAGVVTLTAGDVGQAAAVRGVLVGTGVGTTDEAIGGYFAILNPASNVFTEAFGIYVNDITVGVDNYAIYTKSGTVRFGDELLMAGSGRYINFDTDIGSSGFGFRDNAGTMQFKNDGGSWTDLGGGAGTLQEVSQASDTAAKSTYTLNGTDPVVFEDSSNSAFLTFDETSWEQGQIMDSITPIGFQKVVSDNLFGAGVAGTAEFVQDGTFTDVFSGYINGDLEILGFEKATYWVGVLDFSDLSNQGHANTRYTLPDDGSDPNVVHSVVDVTGYGTQYIQGSGSFFFASQGPAASLMSIAVADGQIGFGQYGSGSLSGTPAYQLWVDASGDVIEVAYSDPTLNDISGYSTNAADSTYDMSSGVTVMFDDSNQDTGLLYTDDSALRSTVNIDYIYDDVQARLVVMNNVTGNWNFFAEGSNAETGWGGRIAVAGYEDSGTRVALASDSTLGSYEFIGYCDDGEYATGALIKAISTTNWTVSGSDESAKLILSSFGGGVEHEGITIEDTGKTTVHLDATFEGDIIFNNASALITSTTNQDITIDPAGSGTLNLKAGSGGIQITTDAGNSDITISPHNSGIVESKNFYPITDDTYYLGKNDDDDPRAWKGVILVDQTTGTYYRLEIDSGTIQLVDLTD